MRRVALNFVLLVMAAAPAAAQRGLGIAGGVLGILGNVLEQQGGSGMSRMGGGGGGQTMFGITCPGQWVNYGGGYSCRCHNGQLGNYVGGQIVCPGGGGGGQRAQSTPPPRSASQGGQDKTEVSQLKKKYTDAKRKCLDRSDIEACRDALTSTRITAKEREALIKKAKTLEKTAAGHAALAPASSGVPHSCGLQRVGEG